MSKLKDKIRKMKEDAVNKAHNVGEEVYWDNIYDKSFRGYYTKLTPSDERGYIKIHNEEKGVRKVPSYYVESVEKTKKRREKENENKMLEQKQKNLEQLEQKLGELKYRDLKSRESLLKENELSQKFSETDIAKVEEIAKSLEPLNNEKLIYFGAESQDNLTKFSDTMLEQVRRADVGEIGDSLESLMKKLKMVDPEELNKKPNLFQKMFKKVKNRVEELIQKHNTISEDVNKISNTLMLSKEALIKDVNLLDTLYNENRAYFEDIELYIKAGELKVSELNEQLNTMKTQASESGDQMAIQEVNDMSQYINRLEKRLHDLKLSRQIALQSAPQIRMVQDINQTLAEKIQSSVLTSIPLWKNQMAISLTLLRQESASKAQQSVTNTTNDLLVRNSEMLKLNSVQSAKENERGIVDVETLKITQNNLVDTIEETLRIQKEGSEKRKQAEKELITMEQDLKSRLLGIKEKYN